jgi:hypothetical protein
MRELDFRTEGGRQFWKNVCDATWLLDGVESYRDDILVGEPRRQMKRNLLAFLALGAFRHTKPGGFTVEQALDRVERLMRRNSHILRLYAVGRQRSIIFDRELRKEPLLVGYIDGFSSVIPLASHVLKHFADTDDTPPMTTEWERHIVSHNKSKPHPYLYVRAAVHLPSLAFREKPPTEESTFRLLKGLLRHIGYFLEPFDYDLVEDCFKPRRGGQQLPKLLCARDSRSAAKTMIDGHGFMPCRTRDVDGNPKFLLDFDSYNERQGHDTVRESVRHAHHIMSALLKWRHGVYLG